MFLPCISKKSGFTGIEIAIVVGLIISLAVSVIAVAKPGTSFEFRRKAFEPCASYTGADACEAVTGCTWTPGSTTTTKDCSGSPPCQAASCTTEDIKNDCTSGWDENTCRSHSGCGFADQVVSCSGKTEAECTSNTFCTAQYSGGSCSGGRCEGASQCPSKGKSACGNDPDCSWTGETCSQRTYTGCSGSYTESTSCTGQYVTGQKCTGQYTETVTSGSCSGTPYASPMPAPPTATPTPECSIGQTKCDNNKSFSCLDGVWSLAGSCNSAPTATPTPVATSTPVPTLSPEARCNDAGGVFCAKDSYSCKSGTQKTPYSTTTSFCCQEKPGCIPLPTQTPIPTSTPIPTATPRPTATPVPTSTPRPTPTPTPAPKQLNESCTGSGQGNCQSGLVCISSPYGSSCQPTCTTNALRCSSSGSYLEKCTNNVWGTQATCPAGCNTTTKACNPTPTPTPTSTPTPRPTATPTPTPTPTPAPRKLNESCNGSGQGNCQSGLVCISSPYGSSCQPTCTTNALRCSSSGSYLEKCTNNVWGTQATCPAGCNTTTKACNPTPTPTATPTPRPTATPTPRPTVTPTPTPTPTPAPRKVNESCTGSGQGNCGAGLVCVGGAPYGTFCKTPACTGSQKQCSTAGGTSQVQVCSNYLWTTQSICPAGCNTTTLLCNPTPTPFDAALIHDISRGDCESQYSGCWLDGNLCVPDGQINAGYYCCKAGTGNGRSFNHFQHESCDAPADTTPQTVTPTSRPSATPTPRQCGGSCVIGSCIQNGLVLGDGGACVLGKICCGNTLRPTLLLPTSIPALTPTPKILAAGTNCARIYPAAKCQPENWSCNISLGPTDCGVNKQCGVYCYNISPLPTPMPKKSTVLTPTPISGLITNPYPPDFVPPTVLDDGVLVDPSIVKTLDDFIQAEAAQGKTVILYSGYRSYAEQKSLYDQCEATKKQTSNPNACQVAPPGYSQHQSGHAVDLYLYENGEYKSMTPLIPLAESMGLTHPIGADTPHFYIL